MSSQFRFLFSPLQMRDVIIPNRIGNSPHASRFVTDPAITNYPSEVLAYYLEERAKGGAGLVIVGVNCVHPTGLIAYGFANIWDDGAIPHYKLITERIHRHPAKVFSQLLHQGREGSGWVSRRPLWAPSAIPDPMSREVPHEMTVEEIDEIVAAFAQAAVRSLEVGFDGVEIHAAHGYLLSSFFSPYSNRRADDYGGPLQNRTRFAIRVIDAVRVAIGESVPLGIRISGDEFVPGGLTIEDNVAIAGLLAATGKIDYLSVSQGIYPTIHVICPEMSFPPGCFVHLPAAIKEEVDPVPVMAVARINDPIIAERILAEGQADFILMARPLIADPELPNKAKEGRLDEIRTCVACNIGCRGGPHRGLPITCLQNPAVGFERQYGIDTRQPAPTKKKVMVIGGGPAGLKAAEEAAERGHQVSLYERGSQLGGQVLIAAKAPNRDELAGSVRHLAKQLDRLGVKVTLGVTVTPQLVEQARPDAVIVATGSTPDLPAIPGVDQANVFNVWQALDEEVALGERIAVVDGGEADWKLLGVADLLAQRGKRVELITHLTTVGADVDVMSRVPPIQRLKSKDVQFHTSVALRAIKGNTLVLADVFNGDERELAGIDSVVLAWYNKADDALLKALRGKVADLRAAGDCVAPRKAIDAIRDGFMAGRDV